MKVKRLSLREWIRKWSRISDSHEAIADIFDDLANHGKFDEEGGELSDQDWADSQ